MSSGHRIIAFSGHTGSGKSTSATAIEKWWCTFNADATEQSAVRVVHINFADRLKQLAALIFRFDVQLGYSQEGKKTFIESAGMTVGEIFQTLGNSMRRDYGEDFWLKELGRTMDAVIAEERGDERQSLLFVVGDLRYPNEAEFLRQRGALLFRLVGDPQRERANSTRDLTHESEVALDHWPTQNYDLVLNTDKLGVQDVVRCCLEKMQVLAQTTN